MARTDEHLRTSGIRAVPEREEASMRLEGARSRVVGTRRRLVLAPLLVAAVAVVALAAGCGAKDSTDSTASTAAPPATTAPSTTTTMPATTTTMATTTTAATSLTLAALAAQFDCTGVTPDPVVRPQAVESGTCTRSGIVYEIATFPPGTMLMAMDHPDLCANSLEAIITPQDPMGPQWEVAPKAKVDPKNVTDVAKALDGKMTLVQC